MSANPLVFVIVIVVCKSLTVEDTSGIELKVLVSRVPSVPMWDYQSHRSSAV